MHRKTHSAFALLLAAAAIKPAQAAFAFFDPEDEAAVPATISALGLYGDMASRTVAPEAVLYEVNTALWTDAAHKERFIVMKPGGQVVYSATSDVYDYPDGTAFVKNFMLDTVPGDPSTRIFWETRLLVNKEREGQDYWYPFTYSWRMDQMDADLVSLEDGLTRELTIRVGGQAREKKWAYPSKWACETCHTPGGFGADSPPRSVLGFFTAQLNREYGPSPGVNQLQVFFEKGVFQPAALPDFSRLPKWAPLDDESAPLDLRARAYVAANCSYCHGDRGIEAGLPYGIEVNYDFHTNEPKMQLTAYELTWDFGIDGSRLIAPGDPDRSVLLLRIKDRNEAPADYDATALQMPPLGSYEPDTQAVRVLTRWIAEMPPASVHRPENRPLARGGEPGIRGGVVYLPPAWSVPAGDVRVYDLGGRELSLQSVTPTLFRIRGRVEPGICLVRVGAKVFRKHAL